MADRDNTTTASEKESAAAWRELMGVVHEIAAFSQLHGGDPARLGFDGRTPAQLKRDLRTVQDAQKALAALQETLTTMRR